MSRGWAGLLLLLALGARAGECPVDATRVAEAGRNTLDLVMRSPSCAALHEAAAMRFLSLPSSLEPRDVSWDKYQPLQALARSALHRGDRVLAADRLGEWRAVLVQEAREVSGEFAELSRKAIATEIVETDALIGAVRGATEVPGAPTAPEAPWLRYRAGCGNPAAQWARYASTNVSRADIWLASGRAELAVQALIAEQWTNAMRVGMAPPRLQSLADAAFGAGSYEREVETALAGATLDTHAIGGPRATLPFFGMVLPVPVGIGHPLDGGQLFASHDELVEYLRPVLLSGSERYLHSVSADAWSWAAERDTAVEQTASR